MAKNDADLDMVNQALSKIGEIEIDSFGDESREARHANRTYETDRNAYLQSRVWKFATGQAILAKLEDTPLFGYQSAFQLPPDLLRLDKINEQAIRYEIRGTKLFCEATEVIIEGLFQIGAENYPDYFKKAFIYLLASDYATSIVEDENKSKIFDGKFVRENIIARQTDSMQQSPRRISAQAYPLLAVRG